MLGERPADQFCLVVTALAKAVSMERNGNHEICPPGIRLTRNHLRESSGEPTAQSRDPFVFQQNDRSGKGVIVGAIAPRPFERVEPNSAQAAERASCVCG